MAHENKTGLGGVHNHYGPRSTGTSVGVETSGGSGNSLSLYFTKETLEDKFIPPVVIPKGARFTGGTLTVDEAFAGLTSLTFGEAGEEATNGVKLEGTALEEVGTFELDAEAVGEFAFDSAPASFPGAPRTTGWSTSAPPTPTS